MEINEGDIVQIVDTEHAWFPVLLIVDEVKNWGVRAYAISPRSNDGREPPHSSYTRLEYKSIERVGEAKVLSE